MKNKRKIGKAAVLAIIFLVTSIIFIQPTLAGDLEQIKKVKGQITYLYRMYDETNHTWAFNVTWYEWPCHNEHIWTIFIKRDDMNNDLDEKLELAYNKEYFVTVTYNDICYGFVREFISLEIHDQNLSENTFIHPDIP